MAVQLPHTFRPHQRSYRQKPPPGSAREEGGEETYILSSPGNYLFREAFLSTGFLARTLQLEVRPEDVWVVTPPKCGTTWMQELVWLVAHGADTAAAASAPQVYRFPFLEIEALASWSTELRAADIHSLERTVDNQTKFFANSMEHVVSMPSPRFIKTHHPLSMLPPALLSTAKVIYVGRNVKDVCVSAFYHERPEADFTRWADAFKDGEVMIGNWFEHMREGSRRKDHTNFRFFWYEDMKDDLAGTVRRVAEFLGTRLGEEEVERLVRHLDIDRMRANPMVNKEVEKPATKEAPSFIRKGIVGDWRTHFTAEQSEEWDRWIEEELERTAVQGMRGWK